MSQKLITRVAFAELAAVSGSTITRTCASTLAPACVGRKIDANHPAARGYLARRKFTLGEGGDPRYQEVLAHCVEMDRFTTSAIRTKFRFGGKRAARLLDAMKVAGDVPGTRVGPTPHVRGTAARKAKRKLAPVIKEEPYDIPENIQAFADMTLREIIEKFGTDIRFEDFLKSIRTIEIINEKRLKTAEKEGKLVSRFMVQTGVIDIFNAAHLRLMKDGAKSITAGVISKHASGSGSVEIELYVADVLASFIKPVKSKIKRLLSGF